MVASPNPAPALRLYDRCDEHINGGLPMGILQGLVGFMILIAGSQLYWFFAGVIGFLTSDFIAVHFFNATPGTSLILIGVGGAVISILLTITARKPALILIGFLAGLFAASSLPELFGWAPGFNEWFLLILGGVVGGLFIYFSYAYAVMVLSAIIGSQMIASTVHFGGVNPQVMFLAGLILGIIVQIILAQYMPPSMET